MANTVPVDNEKQITTGKNKLRAQVRELEGQLLAVKKDFETSREKEQERFAAKHIELESAVSDLVNAAARVIKALHGTKEG